MPIEAEKLQSKISALENQNVELMKKIERADANNDNLTKMIDDFMDKQKKDQVLVSSSEELAAKNEALEVQIKRTEATNANLTQMIDDLMNLEVKNKDLDKMNEELTKKVKDLENACQDLENQIPKGNLNELISELQATINKLRRRNKKLQSDIEEMKK